METIHLVALVLAVLGIVVFFYVVLPKINLAPNSAIMVRAILFFAMIGYLAFDFFRKGKYGYLIFLGLGSIAFISLLRSNRKKKPK